MTVRCAVFPAAGLGTRFLPATKAQPKEMLPLVDKPMIQYVVEEAVAAGLDRVAIVTGRGKRAIEDHFDASIELEFYLQERGKWEELAQIKTISDLASVSYIRQKEPLGLGHAILCAFPLVGDEPFAVFLGDDIIVADPPCISQLLAVHERYGEPVRGLDDVEARGAEAGVAVRDGGAGDERAGENNREPAHRASLSPGWGKSALILADGSHQVKERPVRSRSGGRRGRPRRGLGARGPSRRWPSGTPACLRCRSGGR